MKGIERGTEKDGERGDEETKTERNGEIEREVGVVAIRFTRPEQPPPT